MMASRIINTTRTAASTAEDGFKPTRYKMLTTHIIRSVQASPMPATFEILISNASYLIVVFLSNWIPKIITANRQSSGARFRRTTIWPVI